MELYFPDPANASIPSELGEVALPLLSDWDWGNGGKANRWRRAGA